MARDSGFEKPFVTCPSVKLVEPASIVFRRVRGVMICAYIHCVPESHHNHADSLWMTLVFIVALWALIPSFAT